jgi:ribosome modulation factor
LFPRRILAAFIEKEKPMKRQKRDKVARAYTRGYQAGLEGKSRDLCPFGSFETRTSWINGWREGRVNHHHGMTGVAGIQNLELG